MSSNTKPHSVIPPLFPPSKAHWSLSIAIQPSLTSSLTPFKHHLGKNLHHKQSVGGEARVAVCCLWSVFPLLIQNVMPIYYVSSESESARGRYVVLHWIADMSLKSGELWIAFTCEVEVSWREVRDLDNKGSVCSFDRENGKYDQICVMRICSVGISGIVLNAACSQI